ncbi:MAG: CBS domain-containing protein [Acidobacteria bacterium]|nr:CBS domain-containing protein [Acidobacteriota bacterium]
MTRTLDEILPRLLIRDLPLAEPIVVRVGTPVREVIAAMQRASRPCALICEGSRVAGIFTERDIVNRLNLAAVDGAARIETVMTPRPRTLTPDDRVLDAIRLMTREGYRHIPLVHSDGGDPGLLSARDVVVYIAEHFPTEVLNLPPRLHQTLHRMDGG